MFGRIGVSRFAWSAMHGKISLPVTVKVEGSKHDTARHRLFENSCRYRIAVAHDYPRHANIDRDDLRVSFHMDIPSH